VFDIPAAIGGVVMQLIRRRSILALVTLSLLISLTLSFNSAAASPSSDIDPTSLGVSGSSLPSGSVVDFAGVSDNADADASKTHQIHTQLYETLHRITGYRLDFHYSLQGAPITSGYLASIFASSTQATSALDDASGPNSIIVSLGIAQPLTPPCSFGEACRAFAGTNPNEPDRRAILVDFTRGRILIEMAGEAPAASFDSLKSTLQETLYGLAATVDAKVQSALKLDSQGTVTPTNTSTSTPTATATVTKSASKVVKKHQKCKKGYKLQHGKCKKVKKAKKKKAKKH
jgi:hypothetical protein